MMFVQAYMSSLLEQGDYFQLINRLSVIRTLHIDARDIFNPEIGKDSPVYYQLRTLIDNCTEEEAATLLSVCETIISAFRNKDGTVLKQKKSQPPLG